MKIIQSTLKLTLVLYLCAALSGIYVLSASARITPHEGGDDTSLITIEKGDTLWDLCQEYLEDPLRWRELSQYNDFTNPDLIYPGEKLRIPKKMLKDMEKEAEQKVVENQEALEKLRAELAESESDREKLEAEIKDLNTSTEKLKKQLKELEANLKSQDKLLDAFKESSGDTANDIKRAVRSNKNALQKQIKDLHGHIDSSHKMLTDLQKDLKATQEQVKSANDGVKNVLAQIEKNQQTVSEIHKLMKDSHGVHEEVSSTKRALVLLTTAAAGIGWFVINMIGARSGE